MLTVLNSCCTFTARSPITNTKTNTSMRFSTTFKSLCILILCIVFSNSLFGQNRTYTTNGTFTPPAGVTSIRVDLWGAGGNGGGATGNPASGGGGAGGAYTRHNAWPVTAGTVYTVNIGTAPAPGTGNGAQGGSTWFQSNTSLLAVGGNGGARANNNSQGAAGGSGPTTGNIGGQVNFYGGAGSAGVATGGTQYGGAGGSSAGNSANGNAAAGTNGGIAPAGGGAGAAGFAGSGNGNNANTRGGGGSGARAGSNTDRTGGAGGSGYAEIYYTCPTYTLSATTFVTAVRCAGSNATVRLNGLPRGTYSITYNLSGSNTLANQTVSVTVNASGVGEFTTPNLTNAGTTTVTITNASSGTAPDICSNAISANNTATVTTVTLPAQPSTITGPTTFCTSQILSYSVTAVANTTYNWTFPAGWVQQTGGNSNAITVLTSATPGNVSATPVTACGNGTARTLAVTFALPSVVSSAGASRSGAGTLTLTATPSAGVINWYDAIVGGNLVATGNSFTTPTLLATTNYFIEASNNGCVSSPRIPVVAQITTPEISVTGNGINIVDGDTTPSTTDFTDVGSVNVNASISRTFTITNSGTEPLTVGTITITGTNASEFTVTTAPAATVAVGASTSFTIRFLPTVAGVRTASLSFSNTDSNENPFDFSLAGTAIAVFPEIDIRGNNVSIADNVSGSSSTDHTFFGNITVPGTFTRTFTIFNTGTGPLNLNGTPRVSVTAGTGFVVNSFPAATVAPGGSTTFQITFTAAVEGNSIAVVTVLNNDANEGIFDFVIEANAVVTGAEISVSGNGVVIPDNDTTPSTTDQTDFGSTEQGTNIALPFEVYSLGSLNLTLGTTVSITGTNAAMFTATTLPSGLSPGNFATFVITFTPNNIPGPKTATITITNNDSNESPYNFNIRATVITATTPTTGPGGVVSNLRLWLKANSKIGQVSDNDDITTWEDQVNGNSKTAMARFSSEPKFRNHPDFNVNFNPVISFDGANSMYGNQGFYNNDMFIVVKLRNSISSVSSPLDLFCGDDIANNSQDVTGFQLGNTSSRYTNEILAYNQANSGSYGIAEISTSKRYTGTQIFNPRRSAGTRMEIYNNSQLLTTSEVNTGTYKNIVNSRYWLGRSETFGASYVGDILEIITYGARNSDADRRRIESYLAIKYGMTLAVNGTSVNYVDSASNTIYTAGSGYNFNIAGIGRDDSAGLYQKQSKTENTADDLTIGLNTIATTNDLNTGTINGDRRYLVWGSNNGSLAAQTPVLVNLSSGIPGISTQVDLTSIGRIWRVVETGGDVGPVTVSIPSGMLTSNLNTTEQLLMFVSSTPNFNQSTEYRVLTQNGSNLQCQFDFDGTRFITFGFAPDRTYERALTLDGVNDYLDAGNICNLGNEFTISAWIRKTQNGRSIVSKRDAAFNSGYDFDLANSGRLEFAFYTTQMQRITSNVPIPDNAWYYVSVTGRNGLYRLYIDGVLAAEETLPLVPSNTNAFVIGAADAKAPTAFFQGGIDEVRVFNRELTVDQLRYIMNQELMKNGTDLLGKVLPNYVTKNDIASIPYSSLEVYYPMTTFKFTNVKDESDNDRPATLRNINTIDFQTAPLPYSTQIRGAWDVAETWKNSSVITFPNSLSIVDGTTRVDWNIVETAHEVESNSNQTLLALNVKSGEIEVTNDSKIEVTHYLRLDGKIDLNGQSQLVQTEDSLLDSASTGTIERDQVGQANTYNYNYWCSPVSSSSLPINGGYTVNSVLRDASDPANISPITWTDENDGSPTIPITLANYWLFKFQNSTEDYANWSYVGPDGFLGAAEGFTMKGPGTDTAGQNYAFVGKPNNGDISLPIGGGLLNLCGNPYPSALDANDFIIDNLSAIDGTLYFWEHFSTNYSHNIHEYQGGYAAYSLTGGIPPVIPEGISNLGSSSKVAARYIPVAQGFFVVASPAGGQINFRNSQRNFVRETNADSFLNYRSASNNNPNNAEDPTDEDNNFKKLRLSAISPHGIRRQILIGFMNEFATAEVDKGYDALLFDEYPSDLYVINNESKLVIAGEGYFSEDKVFPLGIKVEVSGTTIIKLDNLENFESGENIYLHDIVTGTWQNLRTGVATLNLEPGIYENRFFITFNATPLSIDQHAKKSCAIAYNSSKNELSIQAESALIEQVQIFDMSGKLVEEIPTEKSTTLSNYRLQNHSSGAYIVRVTTDRGVVSRKLLFR